MKRKINKVIGLFIVSVLFISAFSMICLNANAANYVISIQVTNNQTEARKVLDLVNTFRTGDNAWYWNANNSKKIVLTDLKNLKYDYDLEKIAMQRAAEIALSFGHTRPNGTSCFTCEYNQVGSYGENIAIGYSDAKAVFEAWKEEKYQYDGQGHRRNMLSSGFKTIGIACVNYKGYTCWVQEFGYYDPSETIVEADDSTKDVDVEISSSYISNLNITLSKTSVDVFEGNEVSTPSLKDATVKVKNNFPGRECSIKVKNLSWKSQDESIAKVQGDKIVGLKEGVATIKTNVLGKEVSAKINVMGNTVHTPKKYKLSKTSYVYDGNAKKPSVIVTDADGNTISASNYDITYTSNKAVGTASAKLTFKGNYKDFASKTFTFKINPKGTTISKLTASSKAFTAKWKKQKTQTTGYQILYSTSSKFSGSKNKTVSSNKTVSKKIKSLKKKKKYYVKIRTYKTVSGKKYYSSWSKVKTIKTK